MDASDVGADLAKVLLTELEIRARLVELAARIDADYADKDPLLVGVLKGAVTVMADLTRCLHLPVESDWMAVSSYGSGTKSSGVVRILKDLDRDITGCAPSFRSFVLGRGKLLRSIPINDASMWPWR